jgi:monomeric isocitrate dehydrogenase
MKKKELEQKIAYLESINDQLSTEMSYIDHLMKIVGFSNGIDTVKATANEIINKGYNVNNYPADEV